jgi:hypothetical protein
MLRLAFILLFFIAGAAGAHYFPIRFGAPWDKKPPVNSQTKYLSTSIRARIESLDKDTGTVTLSYNPGYAENDGKKVRFLLRPDIVPSHGRAVMEDKVTIAWETLPFVSYLQAGDVVNVNFAADPVTQSMKIISINSTLKPRIHGQF